MVDGFDERFDVAFLAEDDRRERIGGGESVDGDSGGVVAPVLEPPQAIEKDFEDVPPLSVNVVIQIREYATHYFLSIVNTWIELTI